eukprot:CAMPEP_0204605724 /NCGR_PEP_ID=MMETSP0661-20131031/58653_1 /ASSEMBLY_ACC=CAM_ASM_000606 /TAXON_ID=109239 /ORGANISM="Alexandrium margalefi, Strain AMGDE01CS-322" /LENGTH=261 /DNA_ID=CAMNT_0051616985 /DNA_START=65 /DNA_END=850 /DNA_ORIENTATION=-
MVLASRTLGALSLAALVCQTPAVSITDSARGACQCLDWVPTYRQGLVQCGQGMEVGTMLSVGVPLADAVQSDHGCSIYPKLQGNLCLKAKQGAHLYSGSTAAAADPYDYTWCYVSSSCKQLGGGRKVNGQVSWKTCAEGVDKRYGDLNPRDLMGVITAAGMQGDPTLMTVMAYPYLRVTWAEVEAFFSPDPQAALTLATPLRQRLQDIVNSGKPMMICTSLASPGNGRPDACGAPYTLHVVVGKELWYFPHFQTPRCVQGC